MKQWRAERRAELSLLPEEVQTSAHIYDNGEVAWANEHAEGAVRALADAGFLIQGLDARRHFPEGGVQETPISDYGIALRHSQERGLYNDDEPRVDATPEARRDAALEHLSAAADEGDFVLITYSAPVGGADAKHGIVGGRDASQEWPDPEGALAEIRALAQRIVDGTVLLDEGTQRIAAEALRVGDPVYPLWPELADRFMYGDPSDRPGLEAEVRAAAEDLLRTP